jgi:hypothetical protein
MGETCSLSLGEEHRLIVFEKRVQRRMYGPKREEVAEEWRRMHNEELHKSQFSLNIINMIRSRRMTRMDGFK